MNLKKIFALGMLATALVACDNIDENERLIPVTPQENLNQKNILIEDFTGMNCVNCPSAAAQIKQLQAAYEGRIVPVAIHPEITGFFGPLANELGTTYAEHFGIQSLPKGMVDRQAPEDFDNWATTVANRTLASVPEMGIAVEADYAETGRTLEVSVSCVANESVAGNLQVWITESNIIGFQLTDKGMNQQYTHNHVLRAAMNGTWGEAVVVSETPVSKTYSYAIPNEWNAENLAIVAFVYNDAEGVVQVVEKEVFEHQGGETPAQPEVLFAQGDASESINSVTVSATDGVATLSDLWIKNVGAGGFDGEVSFEILDNPANATLQFTMGEQQFSVTAPVAHALNLPANQSVKLAATATFADGQYGTLKAQVSLNANGVEKKVTLIFENPQPIVSESTFALVNNGVVLEDGATIEVQSSSFEFAPGMGVVTSSTNNPEVAQDLVVKNLTNEDCKVTYTVEVLEQGAAMSFQLCAFNSCDVLTETSYEKTGDLLANTTITTDWHADFEYGHFGTAKTKFSVTVGEETISVFVNFIYAE